MLQLKKHLKMPKIENPLTKYAENSLLPCILTDNKTDEEICAIRVDKLDTDKGELILGTKKANGEEYKTRYVRERFNEQYSEKLNTFKPNSFYYNEVDKILMKTLRWVETDNYGDAIISETYYGEFGAINPYNPSLIDGYIEINAETYKLLKEKLVKEDLNENR